MNTTKAIGIQLKDQVCTLSQSKKLNKLGIAQGISPFYYNEQLGKDSVFYNDSPDNAFYNADSVFSAFTVAELGFMLPDMISTDNHPEKAKRRQYEFWSIKEADCWLARYVAGNDINTHLCRLAEDTEAQVRAEMLIYLLENNYTTAKEVNERLGAHKEVNYE